MADNAQEVVLKIIGDAASGKAAVNAITTALNNAEAAAGQTAKMIEGLNGALGLFGASLSAAGVLGFAHELLRMGDEIVRVADRTGLTTVEVQKLQYIAEQSGNTIDDLTGAIGKLQRGLTLGDDGAVAAVKQLGLNLQTLKTESPYQEMADIATAIQQVEDPAQRATLAIQLFGKSGAAILPTLIADFARLGREAPAMSDETTRALDAAGDSLNKFGRQVKVWAAESYNYAGQIFDRITASAYDGAAAILRAVATFGDIERKIPGVTTLFDKLGISTDAIRQQAQEFTDTGKLLVSHLGDQHEAVRKTATAFVDFEPPVVKATKAVKEHVVAIIGLGDAEKMIEEVLKRQADAFAHQYERLEQLIPATKEWWTLLAQTDGEIQVLASHGLPAATGAVADLGSGVEHLGDQLTHTAEQTSRFAEGFEHTVAGIPMVLAKAFQGGGGFSGAAQSLGAQVGADLAKGIGDKLASNKSGEGLAGLFGKLFSPQSLLGGLASGGLSIGISAAVSGLTALFKHLGPSAEELAARDVFGKQGFANVDAFIAAMSKKGAEVGFGGEALRQALQKVLDATHISASAETSAIDALNKALDDAAAGAKNVADHIAAANAKPDFEGLTQKAAGFGVTLDALGQKFQQASVSKTAADYMTFFDDAKAAGADLGGVLLGMSDEFSTLVQNVIKFGSTLPAAMKPLIQNLIDAGKLTDDQGNAIDDITQIKFEGSPTQTGVDDLKTSLGDATDLVVGPNGVVDAMEKLGATINEQIPTNPFAHWQIPDLNLPSVPNWGGAQAKGGLYHVTRPTLFLAGEKPGGETVAFSGAGKTLGGSVTINNNISGSVWSERELGDVIHEQLSRILRGRNLLRAG